MQFPKIKGSKRSSPDTSQQSFYKDGKPLNIRIQRNDDKRSTRGPFGRKDSNMNASGHMTIFDNRHNYDMMRTQNNSMPNVDSVREVGGRSMMSSTNQGKATFFKSPRDSHLFTQSGFGSSRRSSWLPSKPSTLNTIDCSR